MSNWQIVFCCLYCNFRTEDMDKLIKHNLEQHGTIPLDILIKFYRKESEGK